MHETNCKGLFLQCNSSLKAAKDWEGVVCLSWSCNNYEHQRDALTKTVNTILHYITRGVLSRHKEVFMPLRKCQLYLLQYIGYGSTEYLRKRNFIWNMCREGSQKNHLEPDLASFVITCTFFRVEFFSVCPSKSSFCSFLHEELLSVLRKMGWEVVGGSFSLSGVF